MFLVRDFFCAISLINIDKLLIFKTSNLKDNFFYNLKTRMFAKF